MKKFEFYKPSEMEYINGLMEGCVAEIAKKQEDAILEMIIKTLGWYIPYLGKENIYNYIHLVTVDSTPMSQTYYYEKPNENRKPLFSVNTEIHTEYKDGKATVSITLNPLLKLEL